MNTATYSDVWVCVDCYFAHHCGYRPDGAGGYLIGPDFDPGKDHADREPLGLLGDDMVTDNTCSNHNGTDETKCSECGHGGYENGIREFDRWRCEGCNSALGGTRYRLAVHAEVTPLD